MHTTLNLLQLKKIHTFNVGHPGSCISCCFLFLSVIRIVNIKVRVYNFFFSNYDLYNNERNDTETFFDIVKCENYKIRIIINKHKLLNVKFRPKLNLKSRFIDKVMSIQCFHKILYFCLQLQYGNVGGFELVNYEKQSFLSLEKAKYQETIQYSKYLCIS